MACQEVFYTKSIVKHRHVVSTMACQEVSYTKLVVNHRYIPSTMACQEVSLWLVFDPYGLSRGIPLSSMACQEVLCTPTHFLLFLVFFVLLQSN